MCQQTEATTTIANVMDPTTTTIKKDSLSEGSPISGALEAEEATEAEAKEDVSDEFSSDGDEDDVFGQSSEESSDDFSCLAQVSDDERQKILDYLDEFWSLGTLPPEEETNGDKGEAKLRSLLHRHRATLLLEQRPNSRPLEDRKGQVPEEVEDDVTSKVRPDFRRLQSTPAVEPALRCSKILAIDFPPPGNGLDIRKTLKPIHIFNTASQSNIYSFASVASDQSVGSKLLAATLDSPVYAMELVPFPQDRGDGEEDHPSSSNGFTPPFCSSLPSGLEPSMKEVSFAYVPSSGVDVVGLDAFFRHKLVLDYVIGIALIHHVSDDTAAASPGAFLNVYADPQRPGCGDIDSVAMGCSTLNLDFLPYHLTHSKVPLGNPRIRDAAESVFLMSGSDHRIHMVVEDMAANAWRFMAIEEYFPELSGVFRSVVTWLEINYLDLGLTRRASAVGCEDGSVFVFFVQSDERPPVVLKRWASSFGESPRDFGQSAEKEGDECPATLRGIQAQDGDDDVGLSGSGRVNSLQLFHRHPRAGKVPLSIKPHISYRFEESEYKEEYSSDHSDIPPVNLLAVFGHSPAVVFADVLNEGLKSKQHLQCSDCFDVPTTADVCDVDMDGTKEILLGTFGGEILIFKETKHSSWDLFHRVSSLPPVHSVSCVDLTGDGILEVAALTARGVWVWQNDVNEVKKLRHRRLQKLLEQKKQHV